MYIITHQPIDIKPIGTFFLAISARAPAPCRISTFLPSRRCVDRLEVGPSLVARAGMVWPVAKPVQTALAGTLETTNSRSSRTWH